jgi:hypothetical protein
MVYFLRINSKAVNQNMDKERKKEKHSFSSIALSEQPQIIYIIEFLNINISFLFLLYFPTANRELSHIAEKAPIRRE